MTDTSANIPTYPTESEDFRRALNIQQALDEGTPILKNPADDIFADFSAEVVNLVGASGAAACCVTSESNVVLISSLDNAIQDLQNAGLGLYNHMNTLLFGDDQGTIISGGFSANVGQANSANTLFNTIAGLAGIAATCDLFQEFFGSLLGAAEELFQQALDAIAFAQQALGQIIGGVVGLINQAIAQVQAIANQMIALVQTEIQAFVDWLQRQLDLALGNFLVALQAIPCVGDLLGKVQTPQLESLLNDPLDPLPI